MKRILALSGGGVRGIVEVAFLEAIEAHYQKRGHERLCDVFDLVGGTSTGALVSAAISLGKPVSEIANFYLEKAPRLFGRKRFWLMGLAPIFDSKKLEEEIRVEVGDATLGSPELKTLLAIVAKRLDTGSPWVLSNIPTAPYFDGDPEKGILGNKDYELARLLRASAAAPTLFQQQTLQIVRGDPPGVFVDGGASPYNDPAMALLMLARMKAYGLQWDLGVDNMAILSIGTGRYRKRVPPTKAAGMGPLKLAIATLTGMISDAEGHALTMMQWMGKTDAPEVINSEVGDLGDENLFGEPAFRYQRLDLPIDREELRKAGVDVSQADIERFYSIEDPKIIPDLLAVTREYCAKTFDLDALLP